MVIEAVDELFPVFGSGVVAVMFAVLIRTVPVAAAGDCITTGNVAVAPTASEVAVQVIVPVAPTPGVAQTQPAGGAKETNVAFAVPVISLAVASAKTAPALTAGPRFFTTAVMVKFVLGGTVGADGVFTTDRSAPVAVLTVVTTVAVLFARLGSVVPEVIVSTSTIAFPRACHFPPPRQR